MIAYVTGILGAGKSYYGARKIADALLRGKVVATNVQLVPGWEKIVLSHSPYYRSSKKKEGYEKEIRSRYCFEPDIEYLVSATIRGKGESRGVRVIDEAHNEINNREWLASNQKQVLRRMALARKRGWDDYVLAQHMDNTDMALRRIAGVEIKLINWRNILKFPFFPDAHLLPFHLFLAMAFPMNNHVQRGKRGHKKILWRELYGLGWQSKIYDTFEDFDARHNVNEVDSFVVRYPRLPVPDGYDTRSTHDENDRRLALQNGVTFGIVSEHGEPNEGGTVMPFEVATPTVSAKGIDRGEVLELLAALDNVADGEFLSDGILYEDRTKANAMAAKYIRVGESIQDVQLRSRTWEAPEGGGWYFGIRRKDSTTAAATEPTPEAESAVPEPTPARARSRRA